MVRIIRGPFAGLEGLSASTGGLRVLIEIEVQARALCLEMNSDWVEAVSKGMPVSSVEGSELQQHRNS